MADSDNEIVEESDEEIETENIKVNIEEKPKKKRVLTPEQKLKLAENLKKAREKKEQKKKVSKITSKKVKDIYKKKEAKTEPEPEPEEQVEQVDEPIPDIEELPKKKVSVKKDSKVAKKKKQKIIIQTESDSSSDEEAIIIKTKKSRKKKENNNSQVPTQELPKPELIRQEPEPPQMTLEEYRELKRKEHINKLVQANKNFNFNSFS